MPGPINVDQVEVDSTDARDHRPLFTLDDKLGLTHGRVSYRSRDSQPDGPLDPPHDWTELLHVISGTGVVQLEDELIDVRANDALVILPGTRHRIWATGGSALETMYVSLRS